MSKAFTKEDEGGDTPRPRPVLPLPPGAKNYLTAAGARRLQEEQARLTAERPGLLAKLGQTGLAATEARERLEEVETRLAYLDESRRRAEVVPAPPRPHDTVRFGATVTVREAKGRETTYRIVGVDEADFSRDEVSWLSPIAQALLNARLGARVPFRFPTGATELEIVRIAYEA